MAERRVSIRLVAEGGKVVEQEFRSAAEAERHLRRLTDATGPTNAGLKAIDATAREMRGSLQGLTAALGPLGRVAAALGPVGIAIGATAGGLALLGRQGANAAREIAAVGDAADRLQIDPSLFERLSASLTIQGQSGDRLENAVRTLQQRLGDARSGVRSAADEFARAGIAIDRDFGGTLEEVADAFQRIEDPARRAALANRLFGESGGAMLQVLGQGRDGFAQLSAEAERLGLVYGGALIRESQRVSAEFDRQDRLITTRLNAGLQGFASLWLAVRSAIAEAAGALGGFLDRFASLQSASVSEVERRIERIDQRLSRMGQSTGDPGNFNDYQIEQLQAQRRDLEAELARRQAWQPPTTTDPITVTPPGSPTRPAEDPFMAIVRGFQSQNRDLGMQRRLTMIDGEQERRQLEIAEQALNRLQDAYDEIARRTGQEAPLITPEQIETISAWSGALAEAEAEIRAVAEAQREQTRIAEMNQRAMEAAGQEFVRFIGEVERSERPLQTAIRLLAQLALQTAFGQGPFGQVFNSVLGVAAGGLAGAARGAIFGPTMTSPTPTARPAAFGADFTVPGYGGIDSRRMAFDLTPGERVRITRPGDRMQQGNGQTVIINATTNVAVTAPEGGDSDPATLGQTIAAMVDARIITTLRDQMRPGGALQPVFAA